MKKLIIISLIMAIITGFAVYYYSISLETSLSVDTVPVAVAAKAIPMNTIITPEMVYIKQLPPDAVNSLAIRSIDDLRGRVTKQNIQPDEQILLPNLGELGKNDSGLAFTIKSDYRAMTIKTDEITGVAGYIKKGDRIDIVAVMVQNQDGAKGLPVSEMVAENIEVLEVGASVGSAPEEPVGAYSSVTVSVAAQDALRINFALFEGKYRVLLRSVADTAILNYPPYSP